MPVRRTLFLVAASLFPLVGAANGDKTAIHEFTTDGCSRFPDHSLISNDDWCDCCVAHDLAYWRGGTSEERLVADETLRTCVERNTQNRALADLMFAGVRAGGGPYFYTSYRWGYGWKYGRNYTPLTHAEKTAADAMQAEYLKTNPGLSCPAGQPTTVEVSDLRTDGDSPHIRLASPTLGCSLPSSAEPPSGKTRKTFRI